MVIMDEKAKTPNLKTLKVGDLVSLMQKVLTGFTHRDDCDFQNLKGVCSCGLDQLRKDTVKIIEGFIENNDNG